MEDSLFPISIFLPTSFGEVGQSLGPFLIFTIILNTIKIKIKSIKFSKNNLVIISFFSTNSFIIFYTKEIRLLYLPTNFCLPIFPINYPLIKIFN